MPRLGNRLELDTRSLVTNLTISHMVISYKLDARTAIEYR
jgi:hypothetical protein